MDSINYNASGTVFDIQRFSLHDGPGIRTIVFLKGCPLSCKWCSNPESQNMKPVIMYKKNECLHCGRASTPAAERQSVLKTKPLLTGVSAPAAENVPMPARQERWL